MVSVWINVERKPSRGLPLASHRSPWYAHNFPLTFRRSTRYFHQVSWGLSDTKIDVALRATRLTGTTSGRLSMLLQGAVPTGIFSGVGATPNAQNSDERLRSMYLPQNHTLTTTSTDSRTRTSASPPPAPRSSFSPPLRLLRIDGTFPRARKDNKSSATHCETMGQSIKHVPKNSPCYTR